MISKQKLKEDNDELKQKIVALEEEIRNKAQEVEDSEKGLRDEVKRLTLHCQNSERQVRELSAQITALHARSPDVCFTFCISFYFISFLH